MGGWLRPESPAEKAEVIKISTLPKSLIKVSLEILDTVPLSVAWVFTENNQEDYNSNQKQTLLHVQ